MAEAIGIARIIDQDTLNPELLLKTIYGVKNNWYKMVHRVESYKNIDTEAHKVVVQILRDLV